MSIKFKKQGDSFVRIEETVMDAEQVRHSLESLNLQKQQYMKSLKEIEEEIAEFEKIKD